MQPSQDTPICRTLNARVPLNAAPMPQETRKASRREDGMSTLSHEGLVRQPVAFGLAKAEGARALRGSAGAPALPWHSHFGGPSIRPAYMVSPR